jgi:hypothetical protein
MKPIGKVELPNMGKRTNAAKLKQQQALKQRNRKIKKREKENAVLLNQHDHHSTIKPSQSFARGKWQESDRKQESKPSVEGFNPQAWKPKETV